MKTTIQTLAILALAGSISLAEGDRNREGDRKPQGAEGHRPKPNPAKILEHLDKDGSGSVSKDEFLAGERAQKDPERAAIVFAHMDGNGDGVLTTNEFAQHRPHGGGEGGGEGGDGKRPNPAEVFKHLDKDGSGSISKDEFLSGERAQKNPEMAAKLFAHLDEDGNGDISRDEFAKRPRPDDHKPGDRPKPGDRTVEPRGNNAGGNAGGPNIE